MKWIVPGPNAKVLAHSIHCLAKLGDNLYVDGSQQKLSFRTVNLSKTAFASFNFNPDFFSFYPNVRTQDRPQCQISMKAALIVFRFPSGMERSVESCAVFLKPSDDIVEFRLKYKQGFVKTNKIHLIECDSLEASYEDEQLPSKVVFEPKVLSNILASFQSHEITWAVSNSGVQLRNFSELSDEGSGLRSEVYVSREDIIELSVADEVELTFCLAELRAVITFAEQIGCPIIISFAESGKPIFFIVRTEILVAHIVLATLGLSSTQSTSGLSVSEQEEEPRSKQARIDCSNSQDYNNEEPLEVAGNESVQNETRRGVDFLRKILHREEFDKTKLPGYDIILAPDSDEEEEF